VHAKIDPRLIGLLNAMTEAHDGIACLRTRNNKTGDVEFWVPPETQEDFWEMISGIKEMMHITIVDK